uniref:26S proteasome non-ATPase regulatory subunit 14 n=1 Tax=Sphaerodactylus townsendi TaxID=933632 RepID=A0ACB8G140_9SAUR
MFTKDSTWFVDLFECPAVLAILGAAWKLTKGSIQSAVDASVILLKVMSLDRIQPSHSEMLLNLHKKSWMEGLTLQDYSEHCKLNETVVKEMLELAKNYNKAVEEEDKMTPEQLAIKNVGKQDPKRHLEEHVDVLMTSNIVQCLAAMLDTVVFK